MTDQKKPVPLIMVILAFATVYSVWGSTYFFIEKAVHGFPPFVLGTLRFISTGILMMLWCILKGEKLFIKKTILHAAVGGTLLLFIGNGAVIWVEQFLPSGMVAIIVSSAPIWFVLLDWPLWSENFKSRATVVGLITGFTGVLLLFGEQVISSNAGTIQIGISSMVFLIIGSVGWTAGSLYSKYKSSSGSAIVNTTWQMLLGGLVFIPGSLLRNEWQQVHWSDIPADAWFSLFYLISMGSIAAFSAYVWLLRVRPATQVSTYAYVNPVVAVILGVFFGKESVSSMQIIGLTIILGSVLLINLHKYRKTSGN